MNYFLGNEIEDSVKINQVTAFQPASTMLFAGSGKSGQPFLGTLKSEEAFALEASIEIESLRTDLNANDVPLLMQFYAFNKATNNTIFLGNTEINQHDGHQTAPKALLSHVHLDKGLYRLRVHATLQSNPPLKGYLEVPFMQVQ